MKIAVIDIATGAYAQFWENFYRASEQYFCIGGKISYEHFTDSEELQNSPLPNVNVHREEDNLIQQKRLTHYMCICLYAPLFLTNS